MKQMRGSREGFSLIEVIVAVAILAIIALPILYYFTDAAIHAAKGKSEQEADMAAQSVIEELNAVTDFDGIEERLDKASPDWSIAKDSVGNPIVSTDSKGVTKLEKKQISVDGHIYNANVTVDYSAYPSSVSPTTGDGQYFNDYDNPQFAEIHSDSSVVIEEGDQINLGVTNLYYTLNKATAAEMAADDYKFEEKVPMDSIKANLTRQFMLDVTAVPGSTTLSRVKGYYRFTYTNPTTKATESVDTPIEDKKVETAKFDRVYFMFKPMSASCASETAVINIADMNVNPNNLRINFIRQNSAIILPPDFIYTIHLDSTGGFRYVDANYFANDKIIIQEGVNPDKSKGIIEKKKDKRMALITVEVYRDDDETKEILATSTTSKTI